MARVLESKWTTLTFGVLAVAALVVAGIALKETRDLETEWRAFQAELDVVTGQTADTLRLASLQLSALAEGTFAFEVGVDEEIPVEATVPFSRQLVIPVNTSIPINEEIDTTIEVNAPLGLTVPVDVRVPIDLAVPVDLEIPFTVDETIDVSTSTRIQLTVPIELDVGATELAPLASAFSEDLAELAALIERAG